MEPFLSEGPGVSRWGFWHWLKAGSELSACFQSFAFNPCSNNHRISNSQGKKYFHLNYLSLQSREEETTAEGFIQREVATEVTCRLGRRDHLPCLFLSVQGVSPGFPLNLRKASAGFCLSAHAAYAAFPGLGYLLARGNSSSHDPDGNHCEASPFPPPTVEQPQGWLETPAQEKTTVLLGILNVISPVRPQCEPLADAGRVERLWERRQWTCFPTWLFSDGF